VEADLGLFPLCRIVKFVDGLSASVLEAASRPLLEGFLGSLTVRNVRLPPRANSVTLDTAEAIGQCSRRMSEMKPVPNASRGISLGLEGDAHTKSDWDLLLHRGPLPVLELTTLTDSGFLPAAGWGASLVEFRTADVFCDEKGYLGGQHSIYLLLKQQRLFPYSTGKTTPEAIAAGLELRRACLKISNQKSPYKLELYRLSGGSSKKRHFLRQFDSALLDADGSNSLAKVLKAMGTDIQDWLQEK
jgi:hypothetical protein